MIPILICIPFWEGDKTQAIELCKIVAGLQAHHAGTTAHVLLVARQDSAIDNNMINIVSPKFNIFTYKSTSPLKGWPAGANGIFGSTMIHISNNFSSKYECVYWMEPDCTPICPNWYWALVLEWRRRHPAANIIGCRHDCNGNGTGDHITGCAIYHPNIARIMPDITKCDRVAWDYQLRARIVAMGGHTKLIENWYKATHAPVGLVEDRISKGVVLIHGFKSNELTSQVLKRYSIAR